MEQYPQEISSLYAAVSDVETELIALQAKLLATRCNHELQAEVEAGFASSATGHGDATDEHAGAGMSISRLPPPSTSSPPQRSCSPADADSGASISRLGISWSALKQFCSEHEDKLQGLTTKEVQDLIIKPATVQIKGPYSDLHPEMFQKANVFVSHAWRCMFLTDLIPAIQTWLEMQSLLSAAEVFFWIDIFVVSQHDDPPENHDSEEEARNFQIFSDGFEEALQDIGRAVIVLSPWNRPEWMFRIWCLFEFYVMMRFQIPFEFVLPQEQNDSFIQQLGGEGNDFLTMVSTLDMEKADAFSEYDKRRIKQLVLDHLGGYSKLNESSIGAIRDFCIRKAVDAISIMTDEEKASNNLLDNSGLMLLDVGDLETALQYLSEALQLKIGRHGPDDAAVAATYGNIGNVLESLGKLEEALEMHQKCLEIERQVFSDNHAAVAATEKNIGGVLFQKGEYDNALVRYQKALKIEEQCLGLGHADVASTHVNIGNVYQQQGDNEKALFHFNTALPVLISQLGSSHVDVAKTYNNIGNVLQKLGKLEEALEMFQKSLDIKRQVFSDNHAAVAATEKNIGNVLFQKGEYDNALVRYQKALKIEEQCLGLGHVAVADTNFNMSLVHKALGNYAESLELINNASAIYTSCLGPSHPSSINAGKTAQRIKGLASFPSSPCDADDFNVSKRHRGRLGDVHLENSVLMFKDFCTVRAECLCPLGSRGYFELEIICKGDTTQWGFCTERFLQVDGYTGLGVGDDLDSWGVDGDRGILWHSGEAGLYPCYWKDGDVIGLACDLALDNVEEPSCCIRVSVNGEFQENSVAFSLPPNLEGLYPAVTSKAGSVRIRLGGRLQPFLYKPPTESFQPMAAFARASI